MRNISVIILHVALCIILLGATVTHFCALTGKVHLREGKPANHFVGDDGLIHQFPFNVTLESFDVVYYGDSISAKNYVSRLSWQVSADAPAESAVVSMNNIASLQHYRLCQSGFDNDGHGSYLLVNHDPWGIGFTYFGYGLLFLSFLLVSMSKRTRMRSYLRKALRQPCMHRLPMRPITLIMLCSMSLLLIVLGLMLRKYMANPLIPVLRSPLLPLHVSVIMLSYVLFLLEAVLSVIALLHLRSADPVRQQSAAGLTVLSRFMLYPAVFLLAVGIFVGAIWANVSWGNYWSWDPKETWALITMIIYAVPLHCGSLRCFRSSRVFHIYMLLALLSVLFTYFGVNWFMPGMHSYA